jgi:cobalamin biosynthesis Mg chelatase CobN
MTDDGHDRFTKVAFAVFAPLVTAGVIGIFTMSTSISRLDERVANLTKTLAERVDYTTQRIDQIAREQRESDRRIGIIEGRTRTN